MEGPLSGIKVLDLGAYGVGPMVVATGIVGELEHPVAGRIRAIGFLVACLMWQSSRLRKLKNLRQRRGPKLRFSELVSPIYLVIHPL